RATDAPRRVAGSGGNGVAVPGAVAHGQPTGGLHSQTFVICSDNPALDLGAAGHGLELSAWIVEKQGFASRTGLCELLRMRRTETFPSRGPSRRRGPGSFRIYRTRPGGAGRG